MIAVAGYLNYSGRLLEEEAGRIASGEDTVLLTAENEGTVLTDTVLDAEDITLDGEISQEAAASDVVEGKYRGGGYAGNRRPGQYIRR